MTATRWNGEPCIASRITATVADNDAFPLYWARHLVGTRRKIVEVTYGGETFYLDDEDGSGWNKVTHGGSPHWAHSNITIDPDSIQSRAEAATDDDATPADLSAEQARAEVERLATELYKAEDCLAFVEECCVIADREQHPVTTSDVREWLRGARCGRQLLADTRDRAALVEVAAQAIRDSNGTPEALEWWRTHPQLIPAHVYAAAVLGVLSASDRAEQYRRGLARGNDT